MLSPQQKQYVKQLKKQAPFVFAHFKVKLPYANLISLMQLLPLHSDKQIPPLFGGQLFAVCSGSCWFGVEAEVCWCVCGLGPLWSDATALRRNKGIPLKEQWDPESCGSSLTDCNKGFTSLFDSIISQQQPFSPAFSFGVTFMFLVYLISFWKHFKKRKNCFLTENHLSLFTKVCSFYTW